MYTEKVIERLAITGAVNPNLNVAASGAASIGLNTAGMDMSLYNRCAAVFSIGVVGASATWNVRLQESSDNTTFTNVVKDDGTTPLALTTKVEVANQIVVLEARADQLTKRYVRAQMDDANGTAASAVGLFLLGFDKRHAPVEDADHNTAFNTAISA